MLTPVEVDVSDAFWPLLEAIVALPRPRLQRTSLFAQMRDWVGAGATFVMNHGGRRLTFEDVNALMYGMRDAAREAGSSMQATLATAAVQRIEDALEADDAASELDERLRIASIDDASMDMAANRVDELLIGFRGLRLTPDAGGFGHTRSTM